MKRALVLLVAAATLALAACSSDSEESGSGGGTDTTAEPASGTTAPVTRPLRILVTNDDGVGAPGIDALVEGLRQLDDVEVVVVAPATNQTGSGGSTTPGPLTVTDATTASGYPAKAVAGYPADTVIWAVDQGGVEGPIDVVLSGINNGLNIGTTVDVSGTVGAARAAAARGIPALAASQGATDPPDFPTGVRYVLEWLEEHRAELLAGSSAGEAPLLENMNIPTCPVGEPRGEAEVVIATAGEFPGAPDCQATVPAPAEDIPAYLVGFVTLSDLPLEPATAAG